MTPTEKLKEILERAEKATPGPWAHERHDSDYRGTGVIWQRSPDWEPGMYSSPNIKHIADITHANGRDPWRGSSGDEFEATSEHIASCDPTTITAIVKELLAWREIGLGVDEFRGVIEYGLEVVMRRHDIDQDVRRAAGIASEALRKIEEAGKAAS